MWYIEIYINSLAYDLATFPCFSNPKISLVAGDMLRTKLKNEDRKKRPREMEIKEMEIRVFKFHVKLVGG